MTTLSQVMDPLTVNQVDIRTLYDFLTVSSLDSVLMNVATSRHLSASTLEIRSALQWLNWRAENVRILLL